jgi:Tfp pilus assembly protein PilX
MITTTNASTQRHGSPDRGAVLLVVLIVLVVLLGLGMTGLFLTSGSIQMNTNINLRNQALLVAEAGLERAKQVLNNPSAIPALPVLLAGKNPTAGDSVPINVNECDGTSKRGAILMDSTTPLQAVSYPSTVVRSTGLPSGLTVLNQPMGQYTVYIRQDQADCRMGNYTCDNAPGGVDSGVCAAVPPAPPPNGAVVVRSEGVASDGRTRVVLEVTMSPSLGKVQATQTPLSALCSAGANGCDDNASVQNGIVVNSGNQQHPPATGGATGAGGAPGAGGATGAGGGTRGGGASGTGGATGCTTNPSTPTLVPQCKRVKIPDVLIVLDQSSSMNQNNQGELDSSGVPYPTGRWAVYVAPIIKYEVNLTQSGLAWGLLLFPNDQTSPGCQVGMGPNLTVDHIDNVNPTCRVNNATAIQNAIPAYAKGQGTPTDYAMRAARDYLTNLSDGNPHYIILATDGTPTCKDATYCYAGTEFGCNNVSATQTAYQELTNTTNAGIFTYVVGVNIGGDQVSGASAISMNNVLNHMATLGGTAQGPCPANDATGNCHAYFPAYDQATLTDALNKIVAKLNSCVIPLTQLPPDPGKVGIGINDGSGHITQIRQRGHGDDSNGYWDYTDSTMQSITLGGAACNLVAQGNCGCLEIFYGCTGVPTLPPTGSCN